MAEAVWDFLQTLLGLELDVSEVGAGQMALRTMLIYIAALVIVRLGSKRFLSRATAFDVIVAIMFGSIMSRAINGSAPFFPTLAGGVVLLGLHWLLAVLAFHTSWFGSIVKGEPVLLVRDGSIQWQGMRRSGLSARDLAEHLRMQGMQPDPSKVQLAYLERNGRVSVVPYKDEPRVLNVSVDNGIETIHLVFE